MEYILKLTFIFNLLDQSEDKSDSIISTPVTFSSNKLLWEARAKAAEESGNAQYKKYSSSAQNDSEKVKKGK